jgi:twitching motility two-component system response regulator PilH
LARKILLADDSVTAQNMGRKILADAGYEVITVNNGSAALKKIGDAKPDLIVLDVYMPGYSGLEVCQRLKEVGDTARIPILLTVGKLEPFKPEEAKRVRADAFIVKPFEASELLSALSKLEDKVVPRADSSKPGRFARATAAIEEGRYDKTMAVEDNDSGWKSRISFPKKKKEKPPQEEIDTGEIYNPVNKDLRTVVEHKVDQAPATHAEAVPAEAHVNVGALAPDGLPKDVTPEEIAALAAAAAQIKGKVAEEKSPTSPAEVPVTASAPVEATKSENVDTPKPESVEPPKLESKEAIPPAEPVAVLEVAANATPATLAAQEAPEKTEEKKPEHKSSPAEVMAAIAGLETEWVSLPAAGLGNGPFTTRNEKESAEPVTMAVAAAADSPASESRWTAVAVALAPEEAAISLEQEMQKAYAAFAAAEGAHSSATEAGPVISETNQASATPAEPPIGEPVETQAAAAVIPAISAPEVAQPLAAVSEAATEAISAAVKELEAVAAKYEAEQSTASTETAPYQAARSEAIESLAVQPEPTIEDKIEERVEAKIEEKVETKAEEKIDEKIEAKVEDQPVEAAVHEPSTQDLAAALTTVFAVPQVEPQAAGPQVEEIKEEQDAAPPVVEAQEPMATTEVSEEKSSSEQVSTEAVPVSRASTAGRTDEMAKRESETAAAWASWRKIRETGGSKPAQPEASPNEAEEVPQDKAAMAVAAGAESTPEEATGSLDSDPEIANIVDSVLADMRPKIVEEIARKLGKKK